MAVAHGADTAHDPHAARGREPRAERTGAPRHSEERTASHDRHRP